MTPQTDPQNLPANLPKPSPLKADPKAHRLLEIYLQTLTSPQTKRTYNTEITQFLHYVLEEGKELPAVTAEDVASYREGLLGAYSPATVAKKLAALRRFLTFTYMGGETRVNPEALKFFAKSPKVGQDPSYNILTEEEVARMLSAARSKNYRDYVLLAVMAACGLREAEVTGLVIGDFQEASEGRVFLRVVGKGQKVRNVPVSPDVWQLVQRFVLASERSFTSRADAKRPLFESREGKNKALTTRAIRYIVKKYVRAAGINKAISPHSIRHTVGTNMALNEAPLLVIQKFLGHSDPKTTLRYIRRAEELTTRAYEYNTLPL